MAFLYCTPPALVLTSPSFFLSPSPPHRCSTPLSPSSRPFHPTWLRVRWAPPPVGWCKLNFDGSVFNDGSRRASVGGVIRAATAASCWPSLRPRSTGQSGWWRPGLKLALACFVERIVVEGDDLVLVQLLRGEETQTRIPAAMHEEIVSLLSRFTEFEVRHIYREGNSVAHTLCRQAYQSPGLWAERDPMPATVWEKIDEDCRGVLHERLCKKKK
uniref:RNase H type-1 domain-containing protein n=1 Tax=Oryza punctata TaxID=4537 RepID=A0A0E0L1A0_ORYPU